MADLNPYEAPIATAPVLTTAAHDAWRARVARAAFFVLGVDAIRALLWRTLTAVAIAYPGSVSESVGSVSLNIVIQLVGAIAMLGAVVRLTSAPASGTLAPTKAFVRAFGAVAVAAHLARFALDAAASSRAATWVGLITLLLDGVIVGGCSAYVASVLALVGLPGAATGARVVAVLYVAASATSAVVSGNATIPALRVLPPGSGATLRALVSLLFVGLAIAALLLIKRLRGADSIPTPAE